MTLLLDMSEDHDDSLAQGSQITLFGYGVAWGWPNRGISSPKTHAPSPDTVNLGLRIGILDRQPRGYPPGRVIALRNPLTR